MRSVRRMIRKLIKGAQNNHIYAIIVGAMVCLPITVLLLAYQKGILYITGFLLMILVFWWIGRFVSNILEAWTG